MEERFFHPDHTELKPSGILGHGLGILGSLFILIGIGSYMARKRYKVLSRFGLLKHWLEFHIFLCTMGTCLVTFHTSFKFGGLVAVSFWSMIAVFLSGIIGRFIYLQIPRSLEGHELSLNEIRDMKQNAAASLKNSFRLDDESLRIITETITPKIKLYYKSIFTRLFNNYSEDRRSLLAVKVLLRRIHSPRNQYREILKLVKGEMRMNRKVERLQAMQKLFNYWHVIHLPFAMVMLIIMIIHVAVTIIFGYRWIF
jgi:hypothetical protein